MIDTDALLPPARQLRIAALARDADRDNSEAEYDARMAFVAIAAAMDMHIDAERPPRWIGLGDMARDLETAANAVAATATGSFDRVGPVMALVLTFGQVASRMGYRAEPAIKSIDDTARDSVEGYREAAE